MATDCARLKIWYSQGCAGSIPVRGTKMRAENEERRALAILRSHFSLRSRSVSRSKIFSFVKMKAVSDGVPFAVPDALRNIRKNGNVVYSCPQLKLDMPDRIIKDIRYYEANVKNSHGVQLGELFLPTADTRYIGQRIARKLNELKFCCGEVDHVYINLIPTIDDHSILISNLDIDRRIKYVDYGLSPVTHNGLTDAEKNALVKHLTFSVLKYISADNESNMNLVEKVKQLTALYDTEIYINYKTKETAKYKVDISYQIKPATASTRAIVNYRDKTDNTVRRGFIPLHDYDDIYYLIDTFSIREGALIFGPKKSYTATIAARRYSTPLKLLISDLDAI
jgi:hypothetical protein